MGSPSPRGALYTFTFHAQTRIRKIVTGVIPSGSWMNSSIPMLSIKSIVMLINICTDWALARTRLWSDFGMGLTDGLITLIDGVPETSDQRVWLFVRCMRVLCDVSLSVVSEIDSLSWSFEEISTVGDEILLVKVLIWYTVLLMHLSEASFPLYGYWKWNIWVCFAVQSINPS